MQILERHMIVLIDMCVLDVYVQHRNYYFFEAVMHLPPKGVVNYHNADHVALCYKLYGNLCTRRNE